MSPMEEYGGLGGCEWGGGRGSGAIGSLDAVMNVTDTVALLCACASKADAASGAAPDFLLRVPVQSILLCAALKNKRPFVSATGNSGRD